MARGWESKSIEAQQEEALEARQNERPRLTSDEAAQRRESDNLRLARASVSRQLESSTSPRYRALLQESLKELDRKIEQVSAADLSTGHASASS